MTTQNKISWQQLFYPALIVAVLLAGTLYFIPLKRFWLVLFWLPVCFINFRKVARAYRAGNSVPLERLVLASKAFLLTLIARLIFTLMNNRFHLF